MVEEVEVKEDEGEISVGGEEEIKIKQAENEMKIKQKAEAETPSEDEKQEGDVEHIADEPGSEKPYSSDFQKIRDQDISQYLWDTLLDYVNKAAKFVHDELLKGVDEGISKHDRGPAKPKATKKEKTSHTTERGKELYDGRDRVAETFARAVTDDHLSSATNIKDKEDREAFKNLMVRANKIAYDVAVSEFLYEKMSKDKDFDFATMDTKAVTNEIQGRVLQNYGKIMSGVTATSLYSECIEGMSYKDAFKACNEYLNIRESESDEIKKQVTRELEAENFVANDKKPSKDIGVKLNAFNRSFENDALVVNSSMKEAVSLVENANLSAEEKLSLQEFQKKANLFQTFEAGTVLDLQKQIKAVDDAYRANKNNPLRARIAAMKRAHGLNPVSQKMVQKYANNAIIKAAANKNAGRK